LAVFTAGVLTLTMSCSSSEPGSSGSGPNSEPSSVVRIKDKGVTAKGGTVQVLMAQDFDSLDPANSYVSDSQEVGRLIYRTLTFVKDTPGEAPAIMPDLAQDLGQPSDGGATWTFKLRPGIKYEDGRPITAQDVKYGVMRSFATDVFSLGATTMVDYLKNDTGFEGPYKTPDKDLTSVETPDESTLIFHFTAPQPQANWMMALPYTAPVPKDKDTRQDYGNHPIASGPYKIENYTRDASLTLVRNDDWDGATDPNRPAHPDRFAIALNVSKDASNNRLLDGRGDNAFAVPLDGTLSPANFSKIQDDPAVGARFINGPGSCVNYVSMNTQKITDPDVRHAIALAIDRQGIQTISGGDLTGSIVDSIIPPTIPGYVAPKLDLKPAGDPDAAKKLLTGKTVPPLHLAINETSETSRQEATQIQANLKAVGLNVVVDAYPGDAYYSVVDKDDAPEMSDGGSWCYDWPTPDSVVLPVFGPDSEGTRWGSNNPAKYFDPKYSKQLQDLKTSSEDPKVIADEYVKLANEVQTTAWPILPTILMNDPEVVGANVTNVGTSEIFTTVDLNTLAVKQ
jgi:peptide/nickel transport system substrate-binding protein